MGFTGALAILGVLVTGARWVLGFFSDSAKLRRLELWLERTKAKGESERERQRADNERIDQQPNKTGQDLIDDLNQKFKG